jgi:protein disulfide-isomerase A1
LYANNEEFKSKVTIAKIDATANDVPDSITGFPTIKLFPAGAKDAPVEYSGSRSVEDLANFVKENGKHGVDAWNARPEEPEESVDAPEPPSEAEPAAEKPEHDEL